MDLRVKEDPKGMRVGQVPHPILYILSLLFINKKKIDLNKIELC